MIPYKTPVNGARDAARMMVRPSQVFQAQMVRVRARSVTERAWQRVGARIQAAMTGQAQNQTER